MASPDRVGFSGVTGKQVEAVLEFAAASLDLQISHQHDLRNMRLGIVVLMTTSWPPIRNNTPAVAAAIVEARAGGLVEVQFGEQ